jgi:hypothetical protein
VHHVLLYYRQENIKQHDKVAAKKHHFLFLSKFKIILDFQLC